MMMKIVRQFGGLANCMFQYSYGLYLEKLGYAVTIDNKSKGKLKHETFEWNRIFPNAYIEEASNFKIWLCGGGSDLISKVRRKLKLTYKYYSAPSALSIPTMREIEDNDYFAGVMHNSLFMNSIKEKIDESFAFLDFEEEKNIILKQELEMCNSVAIHVRKGSDYLKGNSYRGTCNADYYERAIKYMIAHLDSPVFYLFSDNTIWVENNLKNLGVNFKIVDWNPSFGWGNHFDMQLMSYCKHNIIANSTYSWWGAFLNKNREKIVIGPRCWFSKLSPSYRYNDRTLMPDWIAL